MRPGLLVTLLLVVTTLGAGPAGAQEGCQQAHCILLPAVGVYAVAHLERNEVLGSQTNGPTFHAWIYGLFKNTTGAPLCDVRFEIRHSTPEQEEQRSTVTLEVMMPDELEWRVLAPYTWPYSLTAHLQAWRSADCDYIRLTPVAQRVTVLGPNDVLVTGMVRNDMARPMGDLRIRLMPGPGYTHHTDLRLAGVTLAPGAEVGYAATIRLYDHGGATTSFDVSAIGVGE